MPKLKEVFPSNDSLSTLIFQIAVVREDLVIESALLTEVTLPNVDRGDTSYRRAYLFRRHMLSMHTARVVLNEHRDLIKQLNERPANDGQREIGALLAKAQMLLDKRARPGCA